MKATIKALLVLSLFAFTFSSCKDEENEEGELKIEFQKGNNYVSTDSTIAGGTDALIGIEAETEKATDPIIKFNITKSVDNATATTVYTEDIEDVHYEYGYDFKLDSVPGQTQKYTFTIFNRDGIDKAISLTITVQ